MLHDIFVRSSIVERLMQKGGIPFLIIFLNIFTGFSLNGKQPLTQSSPSRPLSCFPLNAEINEFANAPEGTKQKKKKIILRSTA